MKRSSYIGALVKGRISVEWCWIGDREPGTRRAATALVFDVLVADQGKDRALRDHQVRVSLERDLDGGFAKKERVVAGACLHWNESGFAQRSSPRLLAALAGIGHRQAGPGSDDVSSLHSLVVHGGGWEVEPDLGALLAFLDADQNPVADHDQTLVVLMHGFRERGARKLLAVYRTICSSACRLYAHRFF